MTEETEKLHDYIPPGFKEVQQYRTWIVFEFWGGKRVHLSGRAITLNEAFVWIVTNINPRAGTLIDFGWKSILVLESTNEGEP